jgi:hypothetical protein
MGNIRVIGPRSSGKTTYLATLAYWSSLRGQQSYFNVEPMNDEAQELVTAAENIICRGADLEPTGMKYTDIFDLPVYQFKIDVNIPLKKPQVINLIVRDYPGEIFDELASIGTSKTHQDFMDDCLMSEVEGCLVLLSEWQKDSDRRYRQVFQKFLDLAANKNRIVAPSTAKYRKKSMNVIRQRLGMSHNGDNPDQGLRLAVAMSKAERGELWPGRIEPEIDLFERHLPTTKKLLAERMPAKDLAMFALSTFGVFSSNDPRPNRQDEDGHDGRVSFLREVNNWNPYGMIAPLYWLNTGKRIKSDA